MEGGGSEGMDGERMERRKTRGILSSEEAIEKEEEGEEHQHQQLVQLDMHGT